MHEACATLQGTRAASRARPLAPDPHARLACHARAASRRVASPRLASQVVFGLERGVDMTIAKRVPAVAYGTTVAIRFLNNVIGGENFIDLARWAGVQ